MNDRRVIFFDTTLRDGEQAPGYSMTLEEKLRMAEQLERLGAGGLAEYWRVGRRVSGLRS